MSDVPQDVIKLVLYRLPPKSLLRFRSVCKAWCSLIDSKEFINEQLRQSRESNSNRSVLLDSDELFHLRFDDKLVRLDTGNFPCEPKSVVVSCNGLVLISSAYDNIVLWNPSTRKVNKLPSTPLDFPDYTVFMQVRCAFGYDSKHDDYKVIRVVQPIGESEVGSECFPCAKMYSLRSNSWKTIADFPYVLPGETNWGGYLNDTLHTFVESGNRSGSIMAFDLAKEEHYEFPKPEYNRADCCLVSVEVMQGYLTLAISRESINSEIWVMKEYGVKESWVKLLALVPLTSMPCQHLCPLAYSKCGDKVLLVYNGALLMWYDLKTKTRGVACLDGSPFIGDSGDDKIPTFNAVVCVGSLVSPHSPAMAEGKTGRKKISKKRDDDFLSVGFKLVL
ncbi:F-box protein CPR1-like [Andrographis paniculata]|uniref:F-box protein CPR1-like n=1 Tax=Andrographis paniculata TaxID=175694 RepID=UPI0021E86ACB|nr:F-box protein CPR1-like [Andrographis paniculata]